MKVLMISSDSAITEKHSKVQDRMITYGGLVDELHIILLIKRSSAVPGGRIAHNVYVYPTRSRARALFLIDAIRLGKTLQTCDLITTQDPYEAGVAGVFLKKHHRARLQIQIHTDIWSPYFTQLPLNKVREKLAHWALRKADCVRVVSERIRRSLVIQGYTQSIVVHPIYTDVPGLLLKAGSVAHKQKKYPFGKTIVCVGRLEKEKAWVDALNVLIAVRKKYPEAGIVFVGGGPQKKRLMDESTRLGVREFVRFVGPVADVIPYYQNAHILLHTALYEGYGLVLLEAASLGLPVVSTDVGLAGSVFSDGTHALVRPVHDVAGLAEAVGMVFDDPTLQKQITFNARTRAQELFSSTRRDHLAEMKRQWEECGM